MTWKILLVLFLIGGFSMSLVSCKTKEATLRVAFPYAKPASAYEPTRIHLAPEYIFLENVFSPLVEMAAKTGQVEAGVAESYYWSGNELHLAIRRDLKTAKGIVITARDAEFSLKRLLAMPGNTHGDFKELLCGTAEFSSIEQDCGGIHVSGQELILKTTDAGKTFLLPMLTAIDFAVIPKSSVDPKTLQIMDWENTTGPYFVSRNSPDGKIQLKANPNHYHFSKNMPQVVELIPTAHSSLEDYAADKVDFITTIDSARADAVIAFSRGRSDSTLHTTMNIRSFILTFTERGRKELSPAQRFSIGKQIRASIVKSMVGTDGFESSQQFFPAFGEGALDQAQLDRIQRHYNGESVAVPENLKLVLVRLGDNAKFIAGVQSAFPKFEVSEAEKNPNFVKYKSIKEQPHIILSGPDTAFLEDIGLISYSLNAGYFGMNEHERKQWLTMYMAEPSKEARIKLLDKIHEATLSEPVVIPLLVAPYAALARLPWKINLSQLYANNPLWLLQTN